MQKKVSFQIMGKTYTRNSFAKLIRRAAKRLENQPKHVVSNFFQTIDGIKCGCAVGCMLLEAGHGGYLHDDDQLFLVRDAMRKSGVHLTDEPGAELGPIYSYNDTHTAKETAKYLRRIAYMVDHAGKTPEEGAARKKELQTLRSAKVACKTAMSNYVEYKSPTANAIIAARDSLTEDNWHKGAYFAAVDKAGDGNVRLCMCAHGALQVQVNDNVKKEVAVAAWKAPGAVVSSAVAAVVAEAVVVEAAWAGRGWNNRPAWVRESRFGAEAHYILGLVGLTFPFNDAEERTLSEVKAKFTEAAEFAEKVGAGLTNGQPVYCGAV